ncbi:MAG: CRISPR-associated protein Csx20 [Bacteroidia bacterium]
MKLFLLFSHALTPAQERDAHISLGVEQFCYLPEKLQQRWSQVPPEPENITEIAQPIWDWLTKVTTPGDHVLVQGDFGMTYATVHHAFQLGLIPVYATTRRESQEVQLPDGSVRKTLVFAHVRFRKY